MQDKEEGNSVKRARDTDEELEITTRLGKCAKKNPEEELMHRLRDNDVTLTQLDLGYVNIGNASSAWYYQKFIGALTTNTTLVGLNLYGNNVGDAGAKAFSEFLAKNTRLMQLQLRSNGIGPVGGVAIGAALAKNTTLTQLNLRFNRTEAVGAQVISRALLKNTTLAQLDLMDNQIGDVGAKAMSEALAENTALTELDLASNQIGDAGARAISEALRKNTTLTKLNLEDNQINDVGGKAMSEALVGNTTLIKCDVRGNGMGSQCEQKIVLLTNRNKEIVAKKQASFESVKASARVLSILSRHRNGIFFNLPREVNMKIAILTGDSEVHNEAQLMEIANGFFK